MIKQKGTEWECTICGEIFGRIENAVFHDFKKHKDISASNLAFGKQEQPFLSSGSLKESDKEQK